MMQRPAMQVTGPVLDAPDVHELTRFYERLLGWDVEEIEGPRPGRPSGDGWSRLRPADRSTKIEIQFEETFTRPEWPARPGAQGMQVHLDIWVEDVAAGVAWALECGASEATSQPEDATGRGSGSCSTRPDIRSASGDEFARSVPSHWS